MSKKAAFGTKFILYDELEPVEVAQIVNIAGPTLSVDTEDVTTHDSEDAFEEVVSTIIRSGEVTLELVYDPASEGHALFMDFLKGKESQECEIWIPDDESTSIVMSVFVVGHDPEFSYDGAIRVSVTMKPTGPVSLDTWATSEE